MGEFTAQYARQTFELLDQDANGYVSAAELTHTLSTLGDESALRNAAAMMGEAAHLSGARPNGHLSYEQYERMVLADGKSSAWETALQKLLMRALNDDAGLSPRSLQSWADLRAESPGGNVRQCQAKRSRFVKSRLATGADGGDGEGWQWVHDEVTVRIDTSKPFATGHMRECFRMMKMATTNLSVNDSDQELLPSEWKKQRMYVAKRYMELAPERTRQVVFSDVKMQMFAKDCADKYNARSPPKMVDFIEAFVIELQPERSTWFVEAWMAGPYHKHNDNAGLVSNLLISTTDVSKIPSSNEMTSIRNTPQAFSHFTHVCSGGDSMVVDIQGVGDLYTDPQVHSREGYSRSRSRFGLGDLGLAGIGLFYRTHECNACCEYLGLKPLQRTPSELNASKLSPLGSDVTEASEGDDVHQDSPNDRAQLKLNELAEEQSLTRQMTVPTSNNAHHANKVRRLVLEADRPDQPQMRRKRPVADVAKTGTAATTTAASDIEHAHRSDARRDTGDSTNHEWTEGRQLLEALKLKSGQTSDKGLRRYFSQQYDEGSEVETLEGLQHMAVYKSYARKVRAQGFSSICTPRNNICTPRNTRYYLVLQSQHLKRRV